MTQNKNIHGGIDFSDTERFTKNIHGQSTTRMIMFPRSYSYYDRDFYEPEMTGNRLSKKEIDEFLDKIQSQSGKVYYQIFVLCYILAWFGLFNLVGHFIFTGLISGIFIKISLLVGILVMNLLFIFVAQAMEKYFRKKVPALLQKYNPDFKSKNLVWKQLGKGYSIQLFNEHMPAVKNRPPTSLFFYFDKKNKCYRTENYQQTSTEGKLAKSRAVEIMNQFTKDASNSECYLFLVKIGLGLLLIGIIFLLTNLMEGTGEIQKFLLILYGILTVKVIIFLILRRVLGRQSLIRKRMVKLNEEFSVQGLKWHCPTGYYVELWLIYKYNLEVPSFVESAGQIGGNGNDMIEVGNQGIGNQQPLLAP